MFVTTIDQLISHS